MAVFLLNPANAAFAQGQGPYAIKPDRTATIITYVMWMNFVLGITITFMTCALYFHLTDETQTSMPAAFLILGPAFLLAGAILGIVARTLHRRKLRQEQLGREGRILNAKLLHARKPLNDESAHNISCEYTFNNPLGTPLVGRTSGYRPGLRKEDFPLPGTPLLVLYVNDKLFEAL